MTILDFLYTVLVAAIVIVTVFASIALYHLIVILKRIHSVCDFVEEKTEHFLRTFHDMAGKLCGLKTTIDVFGGLLKSIVAQIAEKKISSKKKSKRNTPSDTAE